MTEKQFENRPNKSNVLERENLDLSEELDYYKTKCASLETGLFQADKENEDMRRLINNISLQRDEFHRGARENANRVGKLKKENEELKLLIQNWEALDEEKDEQLNKQNQTLKKLVKENERLKQIINDKEVEWLRDNTVWEQMPTSKRTVTKTTFGDKND